MKILIADQSNLETCVPIKMDLPNLPILAKHLLHLQTSDSNWCGDANTVFRNDDTIVVMNKLDLVKVLDRDMLRRESDGAVFCHISCKTGEGVDHFLRALERMLHKMYVGL